MVGTVVHQELLLGSRRNRLHVFRWLYGGWLILQVFWLYLQFEVAEQTRYQAYYPWWNGAPPPDLPPFIWASAPHVVGGWFADTFVRQQFVLLAIATPALVAGAITDEKRRGTLQHLLVADLDTRPLLLGKLLGRVTQVAVLALAGLPLYAILAGYGGVGPAAVLAFLALSAVTVLAVAAAALLASVWCRQTRDAVLALYAAGLAGGLAVWWSGGVLDGFSPSWVLEPGASEPTETFRRLGLATLCWGSLGGACLGLAVWRLKPAYLRELEGAPPKKPGWRVGRRAPVDDEPVRWRERHVEGLAPAAGLRRMPPWLAVAGVALASAASSALILGVSLAPGASLADAGRALARADFARLEQLVPGAARGFLLQGVAVLLLGSLVVAVRCSGSVTGERERQTWEPLLLTPLSAREMVRGKLWGVMGASYVYLLAYGLPAATLAVVAGPLAVCWVLLWLGVTVLAMYYVGAAGLWSSVRSKSSWQALLKTLAWGYLGAVVLYVPTAIMTGFIYLLILLALMAAEHYLRLPLVRSFVNNFSGTVNVILLLVCIGLALMFWVAARQFLNWAGRWIAERERTRHWHSAPVYRRAKRRARDKVTG